MSCIECTFFEERAENFRKQQQLMYPHVPTPTELISRIDQQSQLIAAEKKKVEQYMARTREHDAASQQAHVSQEQSIAQQQRVDQTRAELDAAVASLSKPFKFAPDAPAFIPSRPTTVPRFEKPSQLRKKNDPQPVEVEHIAAVRDHRTTVGFS